VDVNHVGLLLAHYFDIRMNIFDGIPAELHEEQFDELVNQGKIKIERILSKGHATPSTDWYDQEQHEWLLILKGEAILAFVDEPPVTLKKGDYLNIPAHKKHRVDWTLPDSETIWLAVHYQGDG